MRLRPWALTLVLPLLLGVTACGDDEDDVTGPAGLSGTFTLVSIDGEDLPLAEDTEDSTGGTCTEELTSFKLTFNTGGNGTAAFSGRTNCDTGGAFQTLSFTAPFSFEVNGDRLKLNFGDGDPEEWRFTRSGNTLTLRDEDDSVWVFRKG